MDEEILELLEALIEARGAEMWQTRTEPCPRNCCRETILYCSGCSTKYNLEFVSAPPVEDRPHNANCYYKTDYPKLVAWAKVERELLEADNG